MLELATIAAGLKVGKESINLVKTAIDLIPNDQKKKDAMEALKRVEEAFELSKADMAQKLGYQLCRSHFPPEIKMNIEGHQICRLCEEKTSFDEIDIFAGLKDEILKLLYQYDGRTKKQLAHSLNTNDRKISVALEELQQKEMITTPPVYFIVVGEEPEPTNYYISSQGTKYLLKNSLVK